MSKQLSKRLEQLESARGREIELGEQMRKFWAETSGIPVEEVPHIITRSYTQDEVAAILEERERSQA